MDLIYADAERKDIDIFPAYTLDMAYGSDENDFTCSVDRTNHCCGQGYFIYVEGEEYGGIIDSIQVDTENEEIQYKGRTWHGVLEKKAICPDEGDDYLVLDGEANRVLQQIIDRIGLSGLFCASKENSNIEISGYQMERYVYAYSGIKKMLKEFNAKLKIRWKDAMIILSAEPRYDYSQDEEFDTSQIDFTLQKNYCPVNHMICCGQGDLKDRAVIHIFTDEFGGVQPFAKKEYPMQDSDYILDMSQRVMTDHNEIVEVYDVPNAEITTNYILLKSKPADWAKNCESYFTYEPKIEIIDGEEVDNGGSYKAAAMEEVGYVLQKKQPYDWTENYSSYFCHDAEKDAFKNVTGVSKYILLTAKPGNWSKGYGEYYTKEGSEYKEVSGVTKSKYTRQKKQPSDWKKNYAQYYSVYSDGTKIEYVGVESVTYYTYDRQTSRPTDWNDNYNSYYRRATSKELKKKKSQQWYPVELVNKKVPTWQPKKYYTKHSHEKAPDWKKAVRYTRKDTTVAPEWKANTYFIKQDDQAPLWKKNTYYSSTNKKVAPVWVSGKYFKEVQDRFAVMINDAVEKLKEYHQSDELEINLEETEQTYDIGDIVGTKEQVTGMEAIQEVVKKIIKINNDDIVITYEVS